MRPRSISLAAALRVRTLAALLAGTVAALLATSGTLAPGATPASEATGPIFTDVTAGSGLSFQNVCGAASADKGWITESMGAGAAWLDYDGDGKLDLYLVNGSTHDRPAGAGEPNRLFKGDGAGRFTDVTDQAGVGDRGWGMGVTVGDVDNDGDPDLYVTNLGANVLYRNNGDGTFTDVTKAAGVGDEGWGTAAALFDADGDGDLDLYVGNYVDFATDRIPRRGTPEARKPTCIFRGLQVFCGPHGLIPAQDVFYRNNGDGTFTEATAAAGMRLDKPRFTLGAVSGDVDNDGDADLYVANDSVQNSLWRNRGDGTFEDVGLITLSAMNADGNPQASMGVDLADYDQDGWLDLAVTNFSHDLNTVYRNVSGKYFLDASTMVGMTATTMALSWGVGFFDFDADGDLDLFIANGHVYPQVDQVGMGTQFRQANHLFVQRDGRFHEFSARAGSGFAPVRSFRAAAFADYDDDGDVDILVTALDDAPVLMRNDSARAGHVLQVRLVGSVSNRDGVGARVSVTAGGVTRIRERTGGGSYLAASDPRLHFGLGPARRAEKVDVRWPSGRTQTVTGVPAGQVLTLTEKPGS